MKVKFIDEFRSFALRGNVVDMAVGIIIGAAFGKIVSSLVGDVLMPPIGVLIGGVDFTGFSVEISNGVMLEYGKFIQATFDFVITAIAVFILIRLMNRMRAKHEAADQAIEEVAPKAAEPTKEELLLTEIRDLLKANNKQ